MAARYSTYVFQLSKIWDAYREVDPLSKPVRISARNEKRARKRLPNHLGREWILIESYPKGA